MSRHERKGSRVKEWLFRTRSRSPTPEPPSNTGSKDGTSQVGERSSDESSKIDVKPKTGPIPSSPDTSERDIKPEEKRDSSSHAGPKANVQDGGGEIPPPYSAESPEFNLWEQARGLLGEAERQLLESSVDTQEPEIQNQLQTLVQEKQRTAEEKAWKFDFGGRRIVLRDVVAKIVGWVNTFKGLGDSIAGIDPMHAGIAWAAIKIILQVATSDTEQAGQILVAIELVTCLMSRGRIYEGLYLSPRLIPTSPEYAVNAIEDLQKAMVIMYSKILSFLICYIRLMEQNTLTRIFKAVLEPNSFSAMLTELGKIEDRCETAASVCERHVASASRYLQDANYQILHGMLGEHMKQSEAQMTRFWKKLDDDERCKIFLWISEVPYEADHYTAASQRVAGTGQWLLEHETYDNWRTAKSSKLLWLNGIPGAGKTKLSSKVIDDIRGAVGDGGAGKDAFAYFYCDRNRTDHRDPVVVLRSLVRQLSASKDESTIIPYIEAKYIERKRSGFSRDRLTNEECHELLLHLTKDYSQSNIVIDGLDECDRDTRYVLMDILDDVMAKSTQPVKVYIASRQDQDLRDRYQTRGHLEVTANDNQSDIEKFVLNKMEQSSFCRTKMTAQVRQEVLRTFQDKSQGMFQWAALHIDELLKLNRNKDILAYLDKLPRGLEAAYEKIFGDISSQVGSKRDIAFSVFKILMCSWRPLSPEEMVIAATQMPDGDFCLDPDVDIDYVRDACHNFMVVADGLPEASTAAKLQDIEDDKDVNKSKAQMSARPSSKYRLKVVEDSTAVGPASASRSYSNSICRFAHLSVREYLELHHWSIAETNAYMGSICLRTILRLSQDGLLHEETPAHSKIPASEGDEFEECPVLNIKLRDKEFYRQLVWRDSDEETESSHAEDETPSQTGSVTTGLVAPPFTCFLELSNIHYHANTSTCSSVEIETYIQDFRRTALERWTQYASEAWSLHVRRSNRHESLTSVIDDLIDEFLGEPEESSPSYQAWAVFNQGNLDLTMSKPEQSSNLVGFSRVLLRPRSDPALGCVLLGLNHKLNQWLADGRVDANTKNFKGDTLLLFAIRGGHFDTCRSLLSHQADPNATGPDHASPLQSATVAGDLDIVKLLLRHGADPNLRPSWQGENQLGQYPLYIAVFMGHLDITKALLNAGADVPMSGALKAAVENKRYNVVPLILNKLKGSSQPDWTTKVAVSTVWNEAIHKTAGADILELLYNHGVDIHAANSLHTAAEASNMTAIAWLLEKGMDINQKAPGTRVLRTPLMEMLLHHGNLEVLDSLLTSGANVNDTDIHLNTPVAYAVIHSRLDSLERLLAAGANASTKNKSGESPLLIAIANKDPGFVTALAKHGVDVNELHDTDQGIETPIYAATQGRALGGDRVIQALVRAGAKYKRADLPEAVLRRIDDPEEFERNVERAVSSETGD